MELEGRVNSNLSLVLTVLSGKNGRPELKQPEGLGTCGSSFPDNNLTITTPTAAMLGSPPNVSRGATLPRGSLLGGPSPQPQVFPISTTVFTFLSDLYHESPVCEVRGMAQLVKCSLCRT